MIESLYLFALPIHIATVFLLVPLVLYADFIGSRWVSGKVETLSAQHLTIVHWGVWLGLSIMILSGLTMFFPLKPYLLTLPAFYIKMGFVATLVINGILIGKLMHTASERPFRELSSNEQRKLYISGAVSTVSWVGAVTAALTLKISSPLLNLWYDLINLFH